jgi:hypothetical protein
MPSHGVVDRGASAGEDSAILDVLLRDDAWLHDLSLHGLTTINGWHLTPQSEGIWLALRADNKRPHGPGNAPWNGDESHLAQHNQALGTDVFLLPLALWDGLLWHGIYGHLGLAG